ncbi:amino acid ABC transporter ATP-binding/permease protein [Enterococcus raffinosus]|uniref:ABC transporter ATP-binding protein n=1 Tax=Enterococcus raffinosus TaxID=71452 RepID=A0AAW8T920_9ENTE|nr:ABC transporter ATP-binding protein [Enterococcus raffinosus]MDT2523774.1 ABC transporter ATP-binding protein [Enterococcus raffinosus]MDT2529435.1 ABC transporter ATP-binding protein [Enterococcus raffinosus]MDT2534698.1 ABC transporter ATP-binding protein [Enterococcus raffinosus]MDT2544911.1 ABC transporter ATP-binding protein [Enterococcus raffinosus]MDT2555924.1 ABC transporter ATP-binding protein [Enterococcus raffinosus]
MKDSVLIRWLLSFTKPFKGKMILAILLGILSNLAVVAIPVISTLTLLRLIAGDTVNLSLILTLLIGCGVVRGITRYLEQYQNHDIAFSLLAHIREEIFLALRKIGPARLTGKNSGELITSISTDVEALEVFFAHTISPIFIALGTTLVTFVFLVSFDFALACILLAGQLLIGGIIPFISYRKNLQIGDDYKKAFVQVSQTIMENANSLKDIAQFHLEKKRLGKLTMDSNKLNQENRRRIFQGNSLQLFSELVVIGTTLCVFFYGNSQELAIETIVLSVVLSLSSFGPVLALGNLGNALLTTFSSGRRLYQLVHEEPYVTFEVNSPAVESVDTLAATSLAFHYPNTEKKVLEDISFELQQGHSIGISGESGSGKSTLLKLLMRYWDPDKGTITINDLPLSSLKEDALHHLEGVMEQSTFLFEDTIANNISLKRGSVSQENIEEAAKAAAIHDWILSLPEGYETQLSKLSRGISDGERQRIGLARLLVYDAPLVLLDEPTSNLDYVNEQAILAAFKEKLQDKTMVLVSHRSSTLKIAEKQLHLEKGHFK